MGSEWQKYALTDLYSVSSGLSKPAKDFGEGYPFVSFKDVFYNFFLPDDLSQLVRSTDKEKEKCSVRRGDVFLTRTSETMEDLGMSCVARRDYPEATFNGFCKRLRPSTELPIHPEYVGYCLRTPQFRNEMLAFSTMSTRASLNNEMIGRLNINLPPLPEQKAIAHILGTLDDKIELNRRMNATLEGMAQALFKSWFVDFDPVIDNALAAGNPIPDELAPRAEVRKNALANGTANREAAKHFPAAFQETESMGWIPEGWEVSTIGEECETVGGGTPSTKNPDFWEDGEYPWVTPKDFSALHDKVLLSSSRFLTEEGLSKVSSGLLPIGTVLMSSRAPVGYLAITQIETAINQGFIGMICNKQLPPEFVLQWAESRMDDIKRAAGGSTFAEISKKAFRPFEIIVPSRNAREAYTEFAEAIYARISDAVLATETLTKLRDTLLPKLTGGEVRLPEAESLTEEAIA